MLQNIGPYITVFLVLGLFGDESVELQYTVPANKDLSEYQRLAVIEFEGSGGERVRSELEAKLTEAKVDGTPYFTLVSRDVLDKVLREQSTGQSVRFDERSTASIGKLLGADALVTGTVTEYRVDGKKDVEHRERQKGKDGRRTVVETWYCAGREARVRADIKVIDAKTAAVVTAVPLSGAARDGGCMQESYPSVASDDALLDKAVSGMGNELRFAVAPHEVVRTVKLRTKDTDKSATENLKRGVQYAKGGSWDMASEEWQQVLQKNPNSAAGHYNLGVAYEAEGQLERAREHYKSAARIDPDKLYVGAVITIDERLKTADELQRQMDGREVD